MSSNSDLDARKREISALVDGVNALEGTLKLPVAGCSDEDCDGAHDYDRMEALDIINRIERKAMAAATKEKDSDITDLERHIEAGLSPSSI